MIVGNPSVFAVESSASQFFERPSQRALGFFVVYLKNQKFGVRSSQATLLACSFDAVQRRIARRGLHVARFGAEATAENLVDAVREVIYGDVPLFTLPRSFSAAEFQDALRSSEILWAPDGDAAFDDGSHVFQFDVGDKVRLIGFTNADSRQDVLDTLTEVWLGSEEFYALLEQWRTQFEDEWMHSPKS